MYPISVIINGHRYIIFLSRVPLFTCNKYIENQKNFIPFSVESKVLTTSESTFFFKIIKNIAFMQLLILKNKI